jgi:hypothetical protein
MAKISIMYGIRKFVLSHANKFCEELFVEERINWIHPLKNN